MMGDGANINNVFRTGSMEDVGTRLKFLTELYEIWQEGINILDRYDRNTPGHDEKKNELEISCRLLWYHMTKDFKEGEYKEAIDHLPARVEDIKDDNPKT